MTDLASSIADRVFHYTRNCRCGPCHKQCIECSECDTCRTVILGLIRAEIEKSKSKNEAKGAAA